jgi:hypothetical protein
MAYGGDLTVPHKAHGALQRAMDLIGPAPVILAARISSS